MTPEDHTAPPPPDSDVMLVQRTLAGELRAFDMLVIKYQRRVERLIGRMVRDTDLVQDIAQETFIRAYRALAQFRGDAQFYTWLYRIAVNTAKKQLMELKRDPLVFQSQMKSADDDETSSIRFSWLPRLLRLSVSSKSPRWPAVTSITFRSKA